MKPLRELFERLDPKQKRVAAVVGLVLGLGGIAAAGVSLTLAHAKPQGQAPAASAAASSSAAAMPTGTTSPTASSAPVVVPPTTATITLFTVPAVYATVHWGKTVLGHTSPGHPLVITRRRDSGPLDIIVRPTGYLPVHTRAHTFGDTTVAVKITKPEEKDTLFGYRAPLDAGVDEDAQAAPPVDVPQPPGDPQVGQSPTPQAAPPPAAPPP